MRAWFLVVAVVLGFARAGYPCVCVKYHLPPAPADGATDVPLNALFWASSWDFEPERTRIVEVESGSVVDGIWSDVWIGSADVVAFRPATLRWSPHTTYEVQQYAYPPALADEYPDVIAEGPERVSRFTTGDWELTEPPAAPVATATLTEYGTGGLSSCDEGQYRVSVSFDVPHDALFVVMGRQPFRESRNEHRISGVYEHGAQAETLVFGTQSCDGPWPDASPGDEETFYVGLIDITGELTLGAPITVRLPAELPSDEEEPTSDGDEEGPSPSCSSDGPISAWAVLLLIGGLGVSRRRQCSARRPAGMS